MTVAPAPLPAAAAVEVARRTALVTGASAGIGAAFAERLARDGYDLIIVARRLDRLEALADRLRDEAGVAVDVLVADLTAADELREVERAIEACAILEFLVNCAGVAGYMPFAQLPPDQAESLVRLHVVAPTRLTRAALPGMVVRGRGVIVNVSSGLAFSASLPAPPLPHRAVYAASKSYINTFTEILANELRGTGVQVQALCPGIVRTELHEVARYDLSHVPASFMLEPEDVVTASLAALPLGDVVCIPALGDRGPLADLEQSRERVFDGVRGGSIAERYRP
jgi:short-subunit dehydrogenase